MEAIPTHFRDFKFVNKFLSGEKVIWQQDFYSRLGQEMNTLHKPSNNLPLLISFWGWVQLTTKDSLMFSLMPSHLEELSSQI